MNTTYLSKTFSSLIRHRNYRLLFFSLSISQVGTSIQDIAQSWVILEKTHSAQAIALLTACLFTPYALLGLISAPLLERLNPRKTMIICQSLSMLSAIALSLLCFTGQIELFHLYLFALLRGFIVVVNNPIRQLLIRQCVERSQVPNAIALNTSVFNLAKVLGPAIGGLLLAGLGAAYCFLFNAVSFAFVIHSLFIMQEQELYPYANNKSKQSLLSRISKALGYVFKSRQLSVPFAVLFLVSLLCINFSVVLPIISGMLLQTNAKEFGYINALFGLGAFLGAIVSAYLSKVSFNFMMVSAAGMGMMFILLALAGNIWLTGSLLIITGYFYTTYTTVTSAYIQLRSDEEYQVNTIALYTYILTGINPAGAFLIGFLEKTGGAAAALIIPGIIALLSSLCGYLANKSQ
ncbi:MFS transporter [Chitinophaga filiformis]|uniref:Predicted arabinose efflux permease, MFS family n=1 Tax=Chitinophaga filiformis TaxID=104663 RepID=A0A1G7TTR5_CHIFI|nr:MFS transporter [Chitinophaga filiformis]SDG37940.1 Predicted arabinose efflux permease, MFS family [Chitinophaga filiformis]